MKANKWNMIVPGVLLAGFLLYYLSVKSDQDWPIRNSKQTGSTVVLLRDDLTAGLGDGRHFVEQLRSGLDVNVIDAGRTADTFQLANQRLETDVLVHEPNFVVICLGGNDLHLRTSLSDTESAFATIAERITSSGAMVLYLSTEPPLIGDNWTMGLKQVARKKGVYWIDRIMRDMWNNRKYVSEEEVLTDEGTRLLANRLIAVLNRLMPE